MSELDNARKKINEIDEQLTFSDRIIQTNSLLESNNNFGYIPLAKKLTDYSYNKMVMKCLIGKTKTFMGKDFIRIINYNDYSINLKKQIVNFAT